MRESHVLVLPFPDSRLLPNRKVDRWTKGSATKESRTEAHWLAREQIGLRVSPIEKCRMTYIFYPKSKKVADCDSLVRACKPFIDGIVDAGILTNDSWDVIVERTQRLGGIDKSNPRTEIEIVEV